MKLTLRHGLECPPDVFWGKVFFDADYNQRLYTEALKCSEFEVVSQEGDPSKSITRLMRMTFRLDGSNLITKMFGASLTLSEDGNFEADQGRWVFELSPQKMTEKVGVSGEMRVESVASGGNELISEIDVRAKVLGVGSLIEQYIGDALTKGYGKSSDWTNKWLRDANLASESV